MYAYLPPHAKDFLCELRLGDPGGPDGPDQRCQCYRAWMGSRICSASSDFVGRRGADKQTAVDCPNLRDGVYY